MSQLKVVKVFTWTHHTWNFLWNLINGAKLKVHNDGWFDVNYGWVMLSLNSEEIEQLATLGYEMDIIGNEDEVTIVP